MPGSAVLDGRVLAGRAAGGRGDLPRPGRRYAEAAALAAPQAVQVADRWQCAMSRAQGTCPCPARVCGGSSGAGHARSEDLSKCAAALTERGEGRILGGHHKDGT